MNNNSNSYRQAVVDSINSLLEIEHQIFGKALAILMSSEWEEINEAFDEGNQVEFSLAQLESSSDPNVLTLVGIIKSIRADATTLQDLNGIDDDELNW